MGAKRNNGFTLVEIVIVVVILGILAALALPKVTGPNESIISSEGRQTLITLLGAQQRYFLENGAYSASTASLDVTIPASTYFNAPAVANDAAALASVARSNTHTYTLSINSTGTITCSGAGCAAAKCTKGGGGNQCN